MFVGKALHAISKDGRVSIPSKMREVISKKYESDELYLVLMPGDIICLYPSKEFDILALRLENPGGTSLSQIMGSEREICPSAEVCTIDGFGRILIPPDMREKAKIKNEVLVVGVKSHIEVWNPERWDWARTSRI